jgi:hypothetical protein
MIRCLFCDAQFSTRNSVHRHASRKHGIDPVKYRIEADFKGIPPVCECGCGEVVKWKKGKPNRFKQAHQQRDPVIRKQMINGGCEAAADPEKRAKNSQAITAKWREPEYRACLLTLLEQTKPIRVERLTSTHRNEEHRQAQSKRMLSWWSKPRNRSKMDKLFKSKEFREKVSIGTSKALDDPDRRFILSQHASLMQLLGIIGPNNSKRGWIFNPFIEKWEHYDSSWERIFFEEAIARGFAICRCSMPLPYVFRGESHHYLPDFMTLDGKLIIEIKGRCAEEWSTKLDALKMHCDKQNLSSFVIYKKNDLTKDALWKQLEALS